MTIVKKDGSVTFEFDHNTSDKVYLAGDFNHWNYTQTPLKKSTKGKWAVTLKLTKGEHQFRYVCNNQWYNDSNADKYINNGYGCENSVILID